MKPVRTVALFALAVLVVAAVVVLVIARGGEGGPPFTVGDDSVARGDADGLLRGRRVASVHVAPVDDRWPLGVEVRGPGSRAFDFAVVRLDDDAPPMRVRQVTVAEALGGSNVARDAVRWRSWVAVQPGGVAGARLSLDRWREVGREGVLVRPGRQVRLRTVFTAGPTTGRCQVLDLEDAPLWLQRADGSTGDWERLVARDPEDGEDVDVRSGQHGPLGFRRGDDASCRDGRDLVGLDADAGAP